MTKSTLKNIHKLAAICAFIFIATPAQIAYVKRVILMFVPVLMLSMIATGLTANKLYPGILKGQFKIKQIRLKIAAANGVLILLPAAIVLARWSELSEFGVLYWTVQALEIIVGLINITMIGLNIRDGIRLGRHAK